MIPIAKITPLATVTSSQTTLADTNNSDECTDETKERNDSNTATNTTYTTTTPTFRDDEQQVAAIAERAFETQMSECPDRFGDKDSAAATTIACSPVSCPSASIQILSSEKPEKLAKEPERVSCFSADVSAEAAPVEPAADARCDVDGGGGREWSSEQAATIGCYDGGDTLLTSLLSRVDRVKREADLLSNITTSSSMLGGELDALNHSSDTSPKGFASHSSTSRQSSGIHKLSVASLTDSLRSTYYDSDSSGICWTPKRKLSPPSDWTSSQDHQLHDLRFNLFSSKQRAELNSTHHIIQHLAQRRDELREIDKQLSFIMTQYISKFESAGWPNKEASVQNALPMGTASRIQLPQQANAYHASSLEQSSSFVGGYEQVDDAIDLSLVNSKLTLDANSYMRLSCGPDDLFSGEITDRERRPPVDAVISMSCDRHEEKKAPVTINLKKLRLLGTTETAQKGAIVSNTHLSLSATANGCQLGARLDQSESQQPQPDQTSPLNLITAGNKPPIQSLACRSSSTFSISTPTYTSTPTLRLDSAKSVYHMDAHGQAAYALATGNAATNSCDQQVLFGQQVSPVAPAASVVGPSIMMSNEREPTEMHDLYRLHNRHFRTRQPASEEFYNNIIDDNVAEVLTDRKLEALNHTQALRQHQRLLSEFYSSHCLAYAPVPLSTDGLHPNVAHSSLPAPSGGMTVANGTEVGLNVNGQHPAFSNLSARSVESPAASAAKAAAKLAQTQLQKHNFRCHVCGSGFEDRHRLQQHLSIHLNLDQSWFEERTIKETMAQYESKRGDYFCSSCNQRFESTAEFDRHMQLHGEKPHRCELCNQDNKLVSFRYYRQLLTHLRSHCFIYSCRFVPNCKQTANRKDYLKLHILKHHLNNKLPEQYTI